MTIKNKFNLGQFVYHKTDPDQLKMIITAIMVCIDGGIIYHCSIGSVRDEYYEMELSPDKVYDVTLN